MGQQHAGLRLAEMSKPDYARWFAHLVVHGSVGETEEMIAHIQNDLQWDADNMVDVSIGLVRTWAAIVMDVTGATGKPDQAVLSFGRYDGIDSEAPPSEYVVQRGSASPFPADVTRIEPEEAPASVVAFGRIASAALADDPDTAFAVATAMVENFERDYVDDANQMGVGEMVFYDFLVCTVNALSQVAKDSAMKMFHTDDPRKP